MPEEYSAHIVPRLYYTLRKGPVPPDTAIY